MFIPIDQHGAKYLSEIILNFLETQNIDINDCRGQSYDNASNMSGQYSGLQARIKEVNKYAEYIPCAAHSLNLVGVKAAECVTQVVSYSGFMQKLYTFFSASTFRWNKLSSVFKSIGRVVKTFLTLVGQLELTRLFFYTKDTTRRSKFLKKYQKLKHNLLIQN